MTCDDCGKEYDREHVTRLPSLQDKGVTYTLCDGCLEKLTTFLEEELNND